MKFESMNHANSKAKLYECQLYIRKDDLGVVKATESFYAYMGEASYLPLSEMIFPEDGEIMRQAAKDNVEFLELLTGITNRREGYSLIYLRLESSDETEGGNPMYLVNLYDVREVEQRVNKLEKNTAKYRYFMSLGNQYYFEYTISQKWLIAYKYMNEKAIRVLDVNLDLFEESQVDKAEGNKEQQERIRTFCNYLRSGSASFDMDFDFPSANGEDKTTCKVKGGMMYKDKDVVVGIIVPNQFSMKESYYLTPAARDSGTGLLNKRASMEYAMERLMLRDGKIRWLVMIDIDEFKNINDTYGHLCGDEVINKVAEVLRITIGRRGMIGRFGGDEYFILLEHVKTREELKLLLKTVSKQICYMYDPAFKVTISVGVSQYPKDGKTYEELMGKADMALYIAKEKGKNRHIIYDPQLHGSYHKDTMKINALAHTLSKEKRRAEVISLLNALHSKGISYLLQEAEQNYLREVFGLDGFSVITDYGKKVLCESGNYMGSLPDSEMLLQDEKYVDSFGEEGVLIQSNRVKLRIMEESVKNDKPQQEICSSIQCLTKKKDKPFALIRFDMFHGLRKWSDVEIEMLSIIGGCLGNLLCIESEKTES